MGLVPSLEYPTTGTALPGPLTDNDDKIRNVLNGNVDADNLATGGVTSAKILDGTIVNTDISASADIAGTKLANTGVTASKVGLQSVGVLTIGALTLGAADAAATGAGTQVLETNSTYVDVTAATSRITIGTTGLYAIHTYASVDTVEGVVFTLWKNGASSDVIFSKKKASEVAAYAHAAGRSFILSLTAADYIQLGGKCASGTPSMTGAIHAIYLGPAS